MTLYSYPAFRLREMLEQEQLSASSLYRLMLDRIEMQHSKAVIAVNEILPADTHLGPLGGIPCLVDDGIAVTGLSCSDGSVLRRGKIARTDASAIRRLKEAGASIIGIGNVSEWHVGWTTTNHLFGTTVLPETEDVVLGTSGGIAVGVSTGCAPIGIGIDTGGGMRESAIATRLFALKPTRGRLPPDEDAPLTPTHQLYESIGVVARHPKDLLLALSALAVTTPLDTLPPPTLDELKEMPLSVGVLAYDPKCIRLAESLRQEKHRIQMVPTPFEGHLIDTFRSLQACDRAVQWEGLDTNLFDDPARLLWEHATKVRGMDYARVMGLLCVMQERIEELFAGIDILITPTQEMLFPFNVTGHPALTTPTGWQIVGHKGQEGRLTFFADQPCFFNT